MAGQALSWGLSSKGQALASLLSVFDNGTQMPMVLALTVTSCFALANYVLFARGPRFQKINLMGNERTTYLLMAGLLGAMAMLGPLSIDIVACLPPWRRLGEPWANWCQ